jgi:serine/threonine protein kinase
MEKCNMIEMLEKPCPEQWEGMERLISIFEDAIAISESIDFREFLPDQNHPDYSRIASEMIRIDLEYHWLRGEYRSRAWYESRLPGLFEDEELCQAVSFEIQRLHSTVFESSNVGNISRRERLAPGKQSRSRVFNEFPQPGDQFDQFQIEKEISRGSFAAVYLVHPIDSPGQSIVLKIATELQNEWEMIRRLSHPHIIKALSFHECSRFHAICMPHVGELTMADQIHQLKVNRNHHHATSEWNDYQCSLDRSVTPIAPMVYNDDHHACEFERLARMNSDLLKIRQITAVCRALGHMHRMKMIHRDIKPANILISFHGVPFLIDFNMAIDASAGDSFCDGGTLAYMAPEQLVSYQDGTRVATVSTDIFAAGLTLLEFLSGNLPVGRYRGRLCDILPQMIAERRLIGSKLQGLERLPGGERMIKVLGRCVAADPRARYDDCDQIADELETIFRIELEKARKNARNQDSKAS